MKFGIVAGEVSGDLLGARLIRALLKRYPHATFEGIAGPQMQAAGCRTLFPMESLALMGLTEVLPHIPKVLWIRHRLLKHFMTTPPDVFIGIDAPEFNLSIEKKLKKAGILTVHYTSPTLWAWRPGRIHHITQSTDLMLTLFPFEPNYYKQTTTQAVYVGHPLSEEIKEAPDKMIARQRLNLPWDKTIIALMPGSRAHELHYLAELFIKTAQWCVAQRPQKNFLFTYCMVNAARRQQFETLLKQHAPQLPVQPILNNSRDMISAADIILASPGTKTLEAFLLNRPIVTAYRLSWLTYQLGKYLVKIRRFTLPNILAEKTFIPEFIQSAATVDNLGQSLLDHLEKPGLLAEVQENYRKLKQQLKQSASEEAADTIKELLTRHDSIDSRR